MTKEQFDLILEARIDKIRNTLSSKAKEYASDYDRLANFKKGAALSNGTPAQVLCGYMLKHIVSVMDIVEANSKFSSSIGPSLAAAIDEKIGDTINYLVLLEALLLEGAH